MKKDVRKTILLVEDEQLIAADQAIRIGNWGYEVLTAAGGEEAVNTVNENPHIDLVLMDIDLGDGIDGNETARRILDIRHIPVVFLTSHAEREMVQKVRNITRYGYVLKNSGDFVLQSSIEMAFDLYERETRLKNYTTLLSDFIIRQNDYSEGLTERINLITEFGARLMGTPRAGVWFYNDDYSRIRCFDLYEADTNIHTSEGSIETSELPEYMLTHKKGRVVASYDVLNDPRTSKDPGEYFVSNNVRSIIDAPVWVKGRLSALLSFEQTDKPRKWLPEEEQLAMTLAVYVALCLESEERRKTEFELNEHRRRLSESNNMLKLVIDTIPVRVFWKDRQLRFIGCNRLFAQDAGKTDASELVGKDDYEMGWIEQAEIYRKDDLYVVNSGEPLLNYEEPQTTPEGKRIWLRTSKIPLRDLSGNIVGILGTYHDITEEKIFNEAIINKNNELEASNEELNSALENLEAANIEIKNLLEEKDLLLKEVHHRVKNNMNAIVALLALQVGSVENEKAAEVLNDAQNRVLSMMEVYDSIFVSANYNELHLNHYLSTIVDRIPHIYNVYNKNVKIEKDIEDISVNPKISFPVGIIVNELVTNAYKYAFTGNKNYTLKITAVKKVPKLIEIKITDDGEGLPEGFDPDSIETFGLKLIRMMIKQIGGRISFEQKSGVSWIIDFPV